MKFEQERREYQRAQLDEHHISDSPHKQFSKWMNEAISSEVPDPTAMSVSTIECDGFPQTRIVLLKDFGIEGFTFFTNYGSDKGKAIENSNKVSLHFYWHALERQVRISGYAQKTNSKVSEKYFHSRPQKSQIAAAISEQSGVVSSRKYLETQFKKLAEELKGRNPECPQNWGGYIVKPTKFEFWQGRESRLHDRIVYEKQDSEWRIKRLAP